MRAGPSRRPARLLGVGAILLFASVGMVLAAILLFRPSTFSPKTTAAMAFTANLDGRLLSIDGVSDLPDGAIIGWEVWHESTINDIDAPGPHDPSVPEPKGGSVILAGGRFHASTNLDGWPPGTVEIDVLFKPSAGQPPDIVARFGEAGERLDGPDVHTDSGDERHLLVWSNIVLP